jgi:hypothetical protein
LLRPRWGHVAEWLRAGLQNRLLGFESRRGLHHKLLIFQQIFDCAAGAIGRAQAMPAGRAHRICPGLGGNPRFSALA